MPNFGKSFQRIAQHGVLHEMAKLAQQRRQPDALGGRRGLGAAPRLQRQRVRPATGQKAGQVEKAGAGL